MLRKRLTIATILALLGLLSNRTSAQLPFDDTFTFQGRLLDGGVPANGNHDFHFILIDAAIGVVGTPQTVNDVPVADGLFTVDLDFGTGYFIGNVTGLTVSVRPAGTGSFTDLGFQPINPAPNALFARNSDALDGVDSSAFVLASGDTISGDLTVQGRLEIGSNVSAPGLLALQGSASDEISIYGSASVPVLRFRRTGNGTDWVLRHDDLQFHIQSETSGGEVLTLDALSGDLTVAGGIEIESTTRYLSLHPAAFHVADAFTTFNHNSDGLRSQEPGTNYFFASVSLPHGAEVTGLRAHVVDADAILGNDVQISFRRLTGDSVVGLASLSTNGMTVGLQTLSTTSLSIDIDNANNAYFLRVSWPGSASIVLHGIRFTYVVTEPLP